MSTYTATADYSDLVPAFVTVDAPVGQIECDEHDNVLEPVTELVVTGRGVAHTTITGAEALALAQQLIADEFERNPQTTNVRKFRPDYALNTIRDDYWFQLVDRAISLMVADSTARRMGKRMASKYAGRDSVTGREFQAGTEIYYAGSNGVVIAER